LTPFEGDEEEETEVDVDRTRYCLMVRVMMKRWGRNINTHRTMNGKEITAHPLFSAERHPEQH